MYSYKCSIKPIFLFCQWEIHVRFLPLKYQQWNNTCWNQGIEHIQIHLVSQWGVIIKREEMGQGEGICKHKKTKHIFLFLLRFKSNQVCFLFTAKSHTNKKHLLRQSHDNFTYSIFVNNVKCAPTMARARAHRTH